MHGKRLFIFLLACMPFLLYGQRPGKASWAYGANPYYGGVFRYKKDMDKLELTHLHGLEVYVHKITNGRHTWEKLFNYPELGFAFEYYNYGVPGELGEAYSLTNYLDFTVNHQRRHKWRLNIGTGFVYSTRRFHAEHNPENKAISSKISYVARGTLHHEWQVNEQYFLNLNFSFRHYSNGKLNLPNNGMNFPLIGVGVKYIPNPKPIHYVKDTTKYINKRIRFNAMGSISWREVLQEDIKHKAYSASVFVSKQVTKYNTLLLGVDGYYYERESMIRALNVYKSQNLPEDFELDYDGRQLALTVGSELLIGRMAVILQGGFYIYKPQLLYSDWYQRYGFKYSITDHVFARTTLKAHSRTADMMEFGFGVSI